MTVPCLVPLSMLKPYTGDAAVKPLPMSWKAHAAITVGNLLAWGATDKMPKIKPSYKSGV